MKLRVLETHSPFTRRSPLICSFSLLGAILKEVAHKGGPTSSQNDLLTFNSCDEEKTRPMEEDNPQSNMEIVEKASVGTMPSEPRHEKSKQCPSRVALRTRRECPCCKVTMMRHTLLYKHHCKGSPELKEKTLLEHERIRRRMGPSSEVVLECPQATPG